MSDLFRASNGFLTCENVVLDRAAAALAALVHDEYGDRPLALVAYVHLDGVSDEQLVALAALEQLAPETLLGFPDREMVTSARSRGAWACLDSPCDPADLAWVLDRVATGTISMQDRGHAVPPPPAGLARRTTAAVSSGRRLADPVGER